MNCKVMTEQDANITTRIKNRERMLTLVEETIQKSKDWLKVWNKKLIEAKEKNAKDAIKMCETRIEAEEKWLKSNENFRNQLINGLKEDKKMNKVNE